MQPQSPVHATPIAADERQATLPMAQPAPMPSLPGASDVPNSAPAPVAEQQPQPTPKSLPAMADDGDLIEKEWVNKVKHVVRATAHDPYELNRQFSQIKADYMQKRYGKTIKSED